MIRDKLSILPTNPGCYMMKDGLGRVIYIGKAKNLKKRVSSYFNKQHTDFKTIKLVANIVDFDYIITDSEKDSLILEYNLIKKYKPIYNVVFKDDKSYPYIIVSKNLPITIKVTRNINLKNYLYFGPYPSAKAAHNMVELLNNLFPTKKCKAKSQESCIYYYLNQCSIHNQSGIDDQRKIKDFLNGKVDELLTYVAKQMQYNSKLLKFELAGFYKKMMDDILLIAQKTNVEFKDKDLDAFNFYYHQGYISIQLFIIRNHKLIDRIQEFDAIYQDEKEVFENFIVAYYQKNKAANKILLEHNIDISNLTKIIDAKFIQVTKGKYLDLLDNLYLNAKEYHQKNFLRYYQSDFVKQTSLEKLSRICGYQINYIEAFDNSHFFGEANVSAMIVFRNNDFDKSAYRKYNLQSYQSDYHSMLEVIERRYARLLFEEKELPDLILVDGGKAQVNAAREVLNRLNIAIPVIGMVKNNKHQSDHLFYHDDILIDKADSLYFFITMIQNEIHRFAISFHRKKREKKFQDSFLTKIKNISAKSRKTLITKFNKLSDLEKMSMAQLSEMVGEKDAITIKRQL